MQRLFHNTVLVAMMVLTQLLMAQTQSKVEVQLVDSIRPVVFYGPINANVPEAEEKIQTMHFVANPTSAMKKAVAEDEAFMGKLFQPKWTDLVGLSTLSKDGRDILLAKWKPSSGFSSVSSVSVWDAPDFDLFLFEVDSKLLGSTEAVQQFLEGLFILPNKMLDITAVRFKMPRAAEAKGTVGVGWIEYRQVPQSANANGYEFYFGAYRTSSKAYFCVRTGKRLVPDAFDLGTSFIAERFPPLSERLKQLDITTLLQQFHGGAERDSVVADEILSRKLSPEEFDRVFEAPPADQPTRIYTIAGEMIRLNKVPQFEKDITDLLRKYVEQGQSRAGAISAVLRSLRGTREIDFSDIALDLIHGGLVPQEAIIYLQFRGHTKQTAEKLQELHVPKELEKLKESAVKEIFRRAGIRNFAK